MQADKESASSVLRVRPVRGLILTENAQGEPYHLNDLKRWLHLCVDVHKAQKVDLFVVPSRVDVLVPMLELARDMGVPLSLRTACTESPEVFGDLGALGLFDVFLTPRHLDSPHLDAWFEACRAAGLPVRVEALAPFTSEFDAEAAAERFVQGGATAVHVALADPFVPKPPCANADESRAAVKHMNDLVRALDGRGLEANLLFLPFCHVAEANLTHAANRPGFFVDHQQYDKLCYTFAEDAYGCSPNATGKAISIVLGRGSSLMRGLDERALEWILKHPWAHAKVYMLRKLTMPLRKIRGKPKPLEQTEAAHERERRRTDAKLRRAIGSECAACRFRRICGHRSEAFGKVLPGLSVKAQEGELVAAPLHFSHGQKKHYDPIDAERVEPSPAYLALAEQANEIAVNVPPTREVDSFDYGIEGQWTHQMPGGNRWYSFTNTEKLSTALTRTEPPLTIEVTFGGGIADFIGFSFGRHCKFLCPMETHSHRLLFHVDADGRYVLLRDGKPVPLAEFDQVRYAPERLAGVLEPRISIWNIDGAIVTQTVQLWEGRQEFEAAVTDVKYSVLVVCTRYSRRLQTVLLSIAHQQGIDLKKIEVIVGYVPGVDATDDVIDSIELAHPGLRIVRSPFAEHNTKSKGFLINESARLASGEWIMLLDADTLLPPHMFASLENVPDNYAFAAPDGRVMLDPETTARVLLGEIAPWRQWDELLESHGEFRLREAQGVPIGFCQCFRKTCLEKVEYLEVDHFEGADWIFGHGLRQEFGQEIRLSGVPVLHLDHGGSQWYGTQKQR